MNYSEIRAHNPKLFWDGVGRGAIDYSNIPGLIPVGEGQPNPTITSFLGGPHPPENASFDYKSNIPIGAGGSYPKPFLSFSQRLTNANNSNLGPYARLVGFQSNSIDSIEDTCVPGVSGRFGGGFGIWGRVGVIISGSRSGELGFFAQDWYNANDGQYDAAFWSNYFDIDPSWPDKKAWWAGVSKATINAYLPNTVGVPLVKVQIAYRSPQFENADFYRGSDLGVFNDFSIDLLTVMIGTAALVRWF